MKNKDEVIAFFCSDILRETKKPVYQAGYKEGYLTKRGKNFGGWKTRYFVFWKKLWIAGSVRLAHSNTGLR